MEGEWTPTGAFLKYFAGVALLSLADRRKILPQLLVLLLLVVLLAGQVCNSLRRKLELLHVRFALFDFSSVSALLGRISRGVHNRFSLFNICHDTRLIVILVL